MSSGDSPLVNPSSMHPSSSNSFNQPPINPSDDSSSSYYLHPSDNPGALLVSEIFNGENYVAWSHSIVIALTVKNKGKRNMAYAYAAITTLEVPNQNSNEQQKFCFTPEEFHKLMALANSVQPNSSDQNNVQLAVNLVSISHFSGPVNGKDDWDCS
ncbi:hypothetical protein CK203_068652 [Vitis vinifera]|uniref:Retrotransposon Copia-like N-terminal domain-containing protein n=1 Tax=Vitis vinifera TaxID=29760 RepID=A0A438EEE7_VITVI|nr:hypothetical protein CK203_068652 [Vitis vinifera]